MEPSLIVDQWDNRMGDAPEASWPLSCRKHLRNLSTLMVNVRQLLVGLMSRL